MMSHKSMAMIMLLLTWSHTARVCADLPVHCLINDVLGTWTFSLSSMPQQSMTSCSEDPSTNSSDFSVTLQLPNIAIDNQGKRNGTFTMVYDEGMELRFGESAIFVFFAFTYVRHAAELMLPDSASMSAAETLQQWLHSEHSSGQAMAPGDAAYVSLCHATSQGWLSQLDNKLGSCAWGLKKEAADKPIYFSSNGKTNWHPMSWNDISVVSRRSDHVNEDVVKDHKLRPDFANGGGWVAVNYEFMNNFSLLQLQHMAGFVSDSPQQTVPPVSTLFTSRIAAQQQQHDSTWRAKYPKSWDWRAVNETDYTFPVLEQGACGSCFAVATIDMIQTRVAIKTGNQRRLSLSIQEIVSCSPFAQGCAGGLPFLTCKTVQELGVVSEGCFPYRGGGEKCTDRVTAGVCGDSSSRTFIRDYAYVGGFYGAGSEEAMMTEILEFGPVVVAVDVHSDMLAYNRGIYSRRAGATPGGGTGHAASHIREWEVTNHAMLCVGWGESPQGHKYWIVKNSWGEHWGERGYIRIARGVDEIHIESMAVAAYV